MLGALTLTEKAEFSNTFTLYLMKLHSTEVAGWIIANWNVVDDLHLQLIKYLKQASIKKAQLILSLSLGVVFVNIPRFVDCAKVFINYPVAKLVLESLNNKPKQQKLSICILYILYCS